VSVEALANDGPNDIWIAVHRKIRARRIEGRRKATRRIDIDLLHRALIGRTDSIELKISGDVALVVHIARFQVHVAVKENPQMNFWFYINGPGNVARHVNINIGLGRAYRVHGQISVKRREQIKGWNR